MRQTPWVAAVIILVNSAVSVALVLAFGAFWADMLYMLPQGLIGLWLIAYAGRLQFLSFAKSHRYFGRHRTCAHNRQRGDHRERALGWHIFDVSAKPSVTLTRCRLRAAWAIRSSDRTYVGRILCPIWSIAVGYKLIHSNRSNESECHEKAWV